MLRIAQCLLGKPLRMVTQFWAWGLGCRSLSPGCSVVGGPQEGEGSCLWGSIGSKGVGFYNQGGGNAGEAIVIPFLGLAQSPPICLPTLPPTQG